MPYKLMPHKLHTGSTVVCQFTVEGKHHNLTGFVRHGTPDPDKVAVDILSPLTSEDDLLASPVTFGRILQHGDKGEHATFRYVGED